MINSHPSNFYEHKRYKKRHKKPKSFKDSPKLIV